MSADESIEGKAQPKGGKHLSAADKVRRDHQIITDRLRGMSVQATAAKYEVGITTVKNAWKEWREGNRDRWQGRDPVRLVEDVLNRYEAWIEQLAEIAATADNDAARIGAINSQMSAQARAIDTMMAVGILPRKLGQLRVEIDVRVLAQRVIAVMDEHNVPEGVQMALLAELEGRQDDQGALEVQN